MVLTKTVKIRVNYANVKYYESKGYTIPLKKASLSTYRSTGKEFIYDTNAYIDVNVDDLPEGSKARIDVTCDICGDPNTIGYCDYRKSLRTQGFHACAHCVHIKIQNTNMQRYNVPYASMLPEFQEKAKATSRERFGCDFPMQNKEVYNKAEQTCIDRYNVPRPLQNPEFLEKMQNTCEEKYNTKHPAQLEIFKEKSRNTNRQKFGYDNAKQSPEIKEKIRNNLIGKYGKPSPYTDAVREKRVKTNNQKWGVDFVTQSKEVQQKMKQSNMERYGYENASQSPIIKKKMAESFYRNSSVATSNQQRYIHQLYGGELNGVVAHYNCDIVFNDEKIVVEADLGGHDLCVKLGTMTDEEFMRKEIIRNNYIKKEGFRIIRIISRKDYLPSDTILLQMLQYARDFFAQNPDRSWISFDIDNSCIYNAYYKESSSGLPYDYGKLRKIKKEHLSSPTPQTLSQPSAQ